MRSTAGPRVRRNGDLIGLITWAAAIALVVFVLGDVTALRAAVAVPFLLFAPGYALVAALWGKRLPDGPLRALLALALSLSACIAIALALDSFDVRLTASSFALPSIAVVVAGCLVAAVRRRRAPTPNFPTHGSVRRALRSPWALPSVICVLVATLLLVLLRQPLPNDHVAGYTSLWALPNGSSQVRVGIRSAEGAPTRYRLEATASTRRLGLSVSLRLSPGQAWDGVLDTKPFAPQVVTVRLYRLSQPDRVYREVELRV